MPQPKYRGPVDEEHMKKLTAFSFTRALSDRPRSIVSEFSPGATHAPPTRRGSAISDEPRRTEPPARHSLGVTEEVHRIVHPTHEDEAVSRPLWLLPKLTFLNLGPEIESEVKSGATSPTAIYTDNISSSTFM